MKTFDLRNLAVATLVIFAGAACSPAEEKPVERKYGTEIGAVESMNFHAHETGPDACARREQLVRETNGADLFSFLESFSLNGPVDITAGVKTGEMPLLMHLLSSDKVRPLVESDPASFLDAAKVELKIGQCQLADAANWGLGCRHLWGQTAAAMGCKLEEVVGNPRCQATWARILVKNEIGKCAYVESSPPNDDDAVCKESAQKWAGIRFLAQMNKIYQAKNMFLVAKFPGLFGGSSDAKKSLFLAMVAKTRDFANAGPEHLKNILTEKMPLLPANRSWDAFRDDMESTIGAWVRGTRPELPPTDRLCAFVLAQRSFAQMLALNGYLRPELQNGAAIPLTAERNTLGVAPVPGAYLAMPSDADAEPLVLSPATLAAYDPSKRLIVAGARLPHSSEAPNGRPELLSDRLDRMLGVELFFEATSPFAAWMRPGQPYLLGELDDMASSAILPYEAHALAFGHLGLDFKNLAFLNLKPIKADGAIANPERDTVAGVVLLQSMSADYKGVMLIRDLAKLGRIVARLDAALTKILGADPVELGGKNPFYTVELRPKVQEFHAKVRQLKIPVQILLQRMGEATDPRTGQKVCVSKVAMNLAPGNVAQRMQLLGRCTPAEASEYQAVRRILTSSIFQEAK